MILDKIMKKMSRLHKFIVPLALVKIILVFLVLQLFFSSCENEDYFYDSAIFTEGPLFEIQARLGPQTSSFNVGRTDNFIEVGDTLYLEIEVASNTLFDQISKTDITLSNSEFHSQFVITNSEGESFKPTYFKVSGRVDHYAEGVFHTAFGNINANTALMSPVRGDAFRLYLGFVFPSAASYTFHFINTPNSFLNEEGSVDIYYEKDTQNAKDFRSAYAVYLFQLGSRNQDYDSDGDDLKTHILSEAEYDQAIIDFTVIAKK